MKLDIATINFMLRLKKWEKQSKNGFLPFSKVTPETEKDDYIIFDDSQPLLMDGAVSFPIVRSSLVEDEVGHRIIVSLYGQEVSVKVYVAILFDDVVRNQGYLPDNIVKMGIDNLEKMDLSDADKEELAVYIADFYNGSADEDFIEDDEDFIEDDEDFIEDDDFEDIPYENDIDFDFEDIYEDDEDFEEVPYGDDDDDFDFDSSAVETTTGAYLVIELDDGDDFMTVLVEDGEADVSLTSL